MDFIFRMSTDTPKFSLLQTASRRGGLRASVRVFARVFVSECNPASFPQVRLLLNREPGPWGWEGGLGDLINVISECP